jgi:hypothetical protein
MIDWTNFNSSLLIEVTRPNGIFTCTGVAINSNTIVTAAHCLEGEIIHVRVSLDSEYNPKAKFLDIAGFDLHPDYDSKLSNFKSDMAKIILAQDLPSNITIYPIMKKDSNLTGKLVRLGFGARGEKNIRTLVSPVFRSHRNLENILELDDLFSYSGDSGGPIFLQQNGQMYLIAIHSTLSYGPEGKHSFNPLLAKHKTWLEEHNAMGLGIELQKAV